MRSLTTPLICSPRPTAWCRSRSSPPTLATPGAIWTGSFRNTSGCLQSRSRASCGFRKCTRDGCSTSHQPSFAPSGRRTIMISLTSLKSLSALPDLRPSTTLASSMSLAEPSPPGTNSLFYNTSLPLLAYTYSRAITDLARRERDTMLPEDKKRTAHRTLVTRILEGDRGPRRATAHADRQGRQTADTDHRRGRRRRSGVGRERGSALRTRGLRRHRSGHAAV